MTRRAPPSVCSALRLLAVLPVLVALGGCATVQPYERALHAKPKMQPDPCPEGTLLEQHVYEYREGSAGATSAMGGGCGCN